MKQKNIQVGKYTVKITSNEPSTGKLQDFDRQLKKMSDSYLVNHSNSIVMVA